MRLFDLSSPTFYRRDLRPRLSVCLLSAGFFLGVLASSVCAAAEVPDPPEGRWAAATLALLHHQREMCDVLAVRIIDHWQTLPPTESREEDEDRIREYVLAAQISDLAASRSAGDLVDRFLPGARRETNSETAASLRRLDALIAELCDGVALPVAPVDAFQAKITEVLDRVEVERAELGRLLVVPEETLQTALEPYLLPIQIAGIEAEGEYLAYLESKRPKDKEPTINDRMRAWHQSVYTPAVTPAKKAFGVYLSARKKNDTRTMGKSCRDITSVVSQLLRDERAFDPPDPRLAEPLRKIYVTMRQMSKECAAGRAREVQQHFTELQEELQEAGRMMSRYRLSP